MTGARGFKLNDNNSCDKDKRGCVCGCVWVWVVARWAADRRAWRSFGLTETRHGVERALFPVALLLRANRRLVPGPSLVVVLHLFGQQVVDQSVLHVLLVVLKQVSARYLYNNTAHSRLSGVRKRHVAPRTLAAAMSPQVRDFDSKAVGNRNNNHAKKIFVFVRQRAVLELRSRRSSASVAAPEKNVPPA